MCGPLGSAFCLGISLFGALFLTVLATLIKHDYPYAGEWFETKPETPGEPLPPLNEQRAAAVHALSAAAAMYAALALASGVVVCTHRARGRL